MIMKQLNEKADGVINSKGDYLWSSNPDSIPLFYDKKINKVFVGNKGETHLQSLNQNSVPEDLITGRYWINDNIIGFWNIMPDINIINKSIDAIKSYYNYNIDKSTLSIVVDEKSNNANHKLVPYMDFIQNYLAPKHWNSEEFKQDYALHLADAETKRDKMSDYLRDRSQNISKKLTMDNGKEMPLAQWKALHSTSESKVNKKRINLTENELKNIVYETIKNIIFDFI